MKHYTELWHQMVRVEQSAEQIKEKMAGRPAFDINQAFRSCDQHFTGSISHTDVSGSVCCEGADFGCVD